MGRKKIKSGMGHSEGSEHPGPAHQPRDHNYGSCHPREHKQSSASVSQCDLCMYISIIYATATCVIG